MSEVELRTFSVDVTPPVGMVVCGWLDRSIGVESPLFLRGVILSAGGTHHVVAAIDYCYMIGRSHHRMERALAEGAGVPASQAVVQSNHIHDAPAINEENAEFLGSHADGIHDEDYFSKVLQGATAAVRDALCQSGRAIASVAMTNQKVQQFAATRRCIDENNHAHIRWSRGNEPGGWIQQYPEGRIDPNLAQIAFYDIEDRAMACLNFYACHPQVSNGRRLWSGDTIGIAQDLMRQVHPDVFSVYFTGCAGDVTAGKYTTSVRERDRLVFGTRLFDAMHAALVNAQPQRLASMGWADATARVPLAPVPEHREHYEKVVHDASATRKQKYFAGLKLRRLVEKIDDYPFRLTRLTLNGFAAIFLPSELIVDYQLHAKTTAKKHFEGLAVAAYGDSFLDYVAIDASFAQGGYEVDPVWTEVAPGIEQPIKSAIDELLLRP